MEKFLIKLMTFVVYSVGATLCGTNIAMGIANSQRHNIEYHAAFIGALVGGFFHFLAKVVIISIIIKKYLL